MFHEKSETFHHNQVSGSPIFNRHFQSIVQLNQSGVLSKFKTPSYQIHPTLRLRYFPLHHLTDCNVLFFTVLHKQFPEVYFVVAWLRSREFWLETTTLIKVRFVSMLSHYLTRYYFDSVYQDTLNNNIFKHLCGIFTTLLTLKANETLIQWNLILPSFNF